MSHLLNICVVVFVMVNLISIVENRSYNNGLMFYDLNTKRPFLPPTVSVSRGRSLANFPYSAKGSIWSTFGKPCECTQTLCGCCAGITVKKYDFDQKICANVTYFNPKDEIHLELFLNEKSTSKYGMSPRNPSPFCIPLMLNIPLAMCVQMTNIAIVGDNLNMCMDFVVGMASTQMLEMHFQCMRVGLQGAQWVNAAGQPVIPAGGINKQHNNYEDESGEYFDESEDISTANIETMRKEMTSTETAGHDKQPENLLKNESEMFNTAIQTTKPVIAPIIAPTIIETTTTTTITTTNSNSLHKIKITSLMENKTMINTLMTNSNPMTTGGKAVDNNVADVDADDADDDDDDDDGDVHIVDVKLNDNGENVVSDEMRDNLVKEEEEEYEEEEEDNNDEREITANEADKINDFKDNDDISKDMNIKSVLNDNDNNITNNNNNNNYKKINEISYIIPVTKTANAPSYNGLKINGHKNQLTSDNTMKPQTSTNNNHNKNQDKFQMQNQLNDNFKNLGNPKEIAKRRISKLCTHHLQRTRTARSQLSL